MSLVKIAKSAEMIVRGFVRAVESLPSGGPWAWTKDGSRCLFCRNTRQDGHKVQCPYVTGLHFLKRNFDVIRTADTDLLERIYTHCTMFYSPPEPGPWVNDADGESTHCFFCGKPFPGPHSETCLFEEIKRRLEALDG